MRVAPSLSVLRRFNPNRGLGYLGLAESGTGLAAQAAAATAQVAAGADATAVALMHSNNTLATNNTPFLATGIVDEGAIGPAPTYIALPHFNYATDGGGVDFPYSNPAPHWTTNNKWWTGQTLLNVGVPQWSNDPWEYLRSGLVDSNMTMLKNFCDWYLLAVGKPATTVYNNAQPWTLALSELDLSQHKYIQTTDGPVFLPFSYADLVGIQQITKPYEYGYDEATLASMLAQWVAQVLPNVEDFPSTARLSVSSDPTNTPYPHVMIPAIYRVGSTWISGAAIYIEVVLAVVSVGALAAVLVAGSGIAAAAAGVDASVSAGAESAGGVLAANLTADAGADIGATVATDVAADTLPEVVVAAAAPAVTSLTASSAAAAVTAAATAGAVAVGASNVTVPAASDVETLPEVDVTAAAPSAVSALTVNPAAAAVTAAATAGAAAVGASNVAAPETTDDDNTLPEADVTAEAEPSSIPLVGTTPDLTAGAADVAALTASLPTVNFPATSSTSSIPSSALSSLASGLAKIIGSLFGGSTAATAGTGQTGTTSSTGILGLTSDELFWLLAAGALGAVLITESKNSPHRRKANT
jgi:hypothetical protein